MAARTTRPTIGAASLFVALSIVHLISLLFDWEQLSSWTKPLLMPSLGLVVVFAGGLRFGRRGVLLLSALLFSTLGDVALLGRGSAPFIAGLSSFLLAHLLYIALFVGRTGRGMPRPSSVLFLGWFAVLMIILVPHLDAFLGPVVVYGTVIATMAIVATRCSPLVLGGATLFLLSDSVLAVNRFLPDFALWQPDLIIMLTYIAGQALISWGLITSWTNERPKTVTTTEMKDARA